MSNKITIGDNKKRDSAENKPDLNRVEKNPVQAAEAEQKAVQTSVDENVWGNDHTLINKLSEKQLADRRLYVRIRHFQRIECNKVFDNVEQEPVLLMQPIVFFISDLSMGGIGIICEHPISAGKIIGIPLVLDNIPYDIKCEVVYCIQNDDKFRAGLRIVQRDKSFIRHLKIFIARVSLTGEYANQQSK